MFHVSECVTRLKFLGILNNVTKPINESLTQDTYCDLFKILLKMFFFCHCGLSLFILPVVKAVLLLLGLFSYCFFVTIHHSCPLTLPERRLFQSKLQFLAHFLIF